MPTSDPQTPRRMPWEEYEERAVVAVRKAISGRGAVRDGLRFVELPALFGDEVGSRLALALSAPPYICPRCDALFRSALPRKACPECEKAAEKAAERERIKAEVRAELAQKGGA